MPRADRRTPDERFDALTDTTPGYGRGDCWRWNGTIQAGRYAMLSLEGRPISAVRYAWRRQNGPIPRGSRFVNRCGHVCHNPDHWGCVCNGDIITRTTPSDNP